MRSYLPDLNVWLALSDKRHSHHEQAWRWTRAVKGDYRLLMVRHTQLGILRLLTSQAAMGEEVVTLKAAWRIYDRWMEDSSVEFVSEPENVDRVFRRIAMTFSQDFATPLQVGDGEWRRERRLHLIPSSLADFALFPTHKRRED